MKKRKISKGAKVYFAIFFVFFLVDLITTLMVGPIVHYLETNPLYMLTGSFIPIVIANVVIGCMMTWFYMIRGADYRFFFLNLLTWLCVIRIVAIQNAIKIFMNPPTLEVAMAITDTVKATQYSSTMILYVYLPLVITQIVYYLMKIDHRIVEKV